VSKKNRFVVRKDSCDATGENQWAIWYASTNELWAWSTSSTKAKQLCDLLNSTIYEEGDKSTPATAAEPNPQASKSPANWHSIAGVVNANSKSVKFCVNCQTPDGRLVTVSEWDKREDALAECDRLNAKERAQPQSTAADPVDAPDHYRQGEIECIDAVKAMLGDEGFAYWLRGNMVAYLWRLPHKGEAKKDAGKTRNLAERLERLLGG
jgi:hypothetical protein